MKIQFPILLCIRVKGKNMSGRIKKSHIYATCLGMLMVMLCVVNVEETFGLITTGSATLVNVFEGEEETTTEPEETTTEPEETTESGESTETTESEESTEAEETTEDNETYGDEVTVTQSSSGSVTQTETESEDSGEAKTGDKELLMLWFGLMLLGASICCEIVRERRYRKNSRR